MTRTAVMTTYNVIARHWKRGWELHIEEVGVTQCRNLAEAESMVRDYVESLTGADAGNATIVITPEVGGGLDEQARAAREATTAADRATREAAAQSQVGARSAGRRALWSRYRRDPAGVRAARIATSQVSLRSRDADAALAEVR